MRGLINSLYRIYLRQFCGIALPKDLLRYSAKKHANKIAIIDGERRITYEQLYDRGLYLANTLLHKGLKKGDRLCVLLYNCPEYYEIRIACYLTGIVLVPLIWDLELNDIISIFRETEAKCLIYDPEILSDGAVHSIKGSCKLELYSSISSKESETSYKNLVDSGSDDRVNIDLSVDDLASINFSSGSTGKPKGICLTQRCWINSFFNYVANARGAIREEKTILHMLSLATAGGTAFLPTFFLGATNHFLKRFSAKSAAELILANDVNTAFMSPSYFLRLMDYCRANDIHLPLQTIIVGTEAMPQQKFREAVEFFGPVLQQSYGMAEVLPPLTILTPDDYLNGNNINSEAFRSVGKKLKGVEIKILRDDVEMCGPNEIGRIALKSQTVSAGYWHQDDATRDHFIDGWFLSDDYGYLDKHGYVYIVGRKHDVVKNDVREGVIFRREIEEVLHRYPGVLEAFVFLSEHRGILAQVSPIAGSTALEPASILEFCHGELGVDRSPAEINIVDALPKNASGKIDRQTIMKDNQ